MIFGGFWSPFGDPWDHFGGHFGTCSAKRDLSEALFSDMCSDSEEWAKMEVPRGGSTCNPPMPAQSKQGFPFSVSAPKKYPKSNLLASFVVTLGPCWAILDNFGDVFSDWKIIDFLGGVWNSIFSQKAPVKWRGASL